MWPRTCGVSTAVTRSTVLWRSSRTSALPRAQRWCSQPSAGSTASRPSVRPAPATPRRTPPTGSTTEPSSWSPRASTWTVTARPWTSSPCPLTTPPRRPQRDQLHGIFRLGSAHRRGDGSDLGQVRDPRRRSSPSGMPTHPRRNSPGATRESEAAVTARMVLMPRSPAGPRHGRGRPWLPGGSGSTRHAASPYRGVLA